MNQWDKLSSYFNTHKRIGEIDPGAADNILIAWPAVLAGVRKVQPNGVGRKALDFGCGAGGFCQELVNNKYEVVGSDTSAGMLSVARASLGKKILLYSWGAKELAERKRGSFDLVTAIMVFQFIKDADKELDYLDLILKQGGVLAFAVFNPDYVRTNRGKGRLFFGTSGFKKDGREYMCATKETKIPLFVREASWYDRVLAAKGYKRVLSRKPRFTREFLARYPTGTNTRYSEYLILVYRKGI